MDDSQLLSLEGVKETLRVTKPYKLVSRETHPQPTVITLAAVTIGGGQPVIMAGPCAVESEEQALTIARIVKKHGAQIFRGGAFKPRTSPYSFQGLGEEGLKILAKVARGDRPADRHRGHRPRQHRAGGGVRRHHPDRRPQHAELLAAAPGRAAPTSRSCSSAGFAATIEELLMSAEYIMSEGNTEVILCERGIRTFSDNTRNTLDLSAIPSIKEVSHLPVIVDPSHAAGRREYVIPLSQGRHRRGRRRPDRGGAPRPRPCPLGREAVPVPGAVPELMKDDKEAMTRCGRR